MPTWNPSEYAANSSGQQNWGEELLTKIELKGNERILDIGCGDGRLTAKIAKLVPQGSILGMDSSADMIAHAREKHPPDLYPNLSYQEGDAQDVGFTGEFDLIFSNAALHWVKDHAPMIHNMARALRPGGRFFWQMGGKGNASDIIQKAESIMAQEKWRGYFEGFSFPYGFNGVEDYRAWLEAAGVEPLRVELIAKDMKHDGRDGLAGWFRTTWLPYLDRVPEESKEDFIAQVCDTFVEAYPPADDGKVIVKMVRLEVEAVKPA